MEYFNKIVVLENLLFGLESVVIAYSGGVDSAFLLAKSIEILGKDRTLAVLADSPSLPGNEKKDALELADSINASLMEIETGEIEDPEFAKNPIDRCFYCKNELYKKLSGIRDDHGYSAIADGTNYDDLRLHRPGLKAADLHGVVRPLASSGLTKAEIRMASKGLKLRNWDKPAAACLASRIPYGETITVDRLRQVETAENAVKAIGLKEVRVRWHWDIARIEVGKNEFDLALSCRGLIVEAVKAAGFTYVCLDLEGFRSGSMMKDKEYK